MGQQLRIQQALPKDVGQRVVLLPAGDAPHVSLGLPARSAGRPGMARLWQTRTRAIREVVVLEVADWLGDAVEDLDRAIQVALAEETRGVVCDLSAVLHGTEPGAVEMLAMAGRHVRDWPGTPVGVACPDPQVRAVLKAHPVGRHLIVTESTSSAVSAVLSTPIVVVERLRLAAHPTAPRAARNFVTRILKDWQLDKVIPCASVVVSRLVASSSLNAGTAIDLSVAWNAGALRLTVADHGPVLPGQRPSDLDVQARGRTVAIAGLSRTFGVLPTADGGKVVWAVLEAPQQSRSTSNGMRNAKGETAKNASIIKLPRHDLGISSC